MKTPQIETGHFPITTLAKSFGCDPRGLRKRLDAAGCERSGAGWTIRQAHEALAGDGSIERLRASRIALQDAQRHRLDLEIAEQEHRLVDMAQLKRAYGPIYAEALRLIRDSSMADTEQDALLSAMAKLHHEPITTNEHERLTPKTDC